MALLIASDFFNKSLVGFIKDLLLNNYRINKMENVKPIYVPISKLAKIWGRSKMYIYRRIDMIRNEGKFDQICLQLGFKQKKGMKNE